MTFLQLFILWGLPLCIIPVIIHLLNRMRYRTVDWAAMNFLFKASRSSTGMARIRQILILAARIFAICLLIFAFARPLVGGWLGNSFSGLPDTVIILLDRSASMSMEYGTRVTRLEQTKKLLFPAIENLRGKTSFVIIENVFEKPVKLPSDQTVRELGNLSSTQTKADITSLLDKSLNYLAEEKTGVTEIWICSDMQRSNWIPDDPIWSKLGDKIRILPLKPEIKVLALDSNADENIAVSICGIIKNEKTPEEAELVFEIMRKLTGEQTIPITIDFQGVKKNRSVELKGGTSIFREKIKIQDKEISPAYYGYVEIPTDINPSDNIAYFGFSSGGKYKIATVFQEKSLSSDIFKLAFSTFDTCEKVDTYSPSLAGDMDYKNLSLIVWDAPFPKHEIQNSLKTFISDGGAILFLPASELSTDDKLFDNIQWDSCEIRGNEDPFTIQAWDNTSGPLKNSMSGQPLAVNDLKIIKICPLKEDNLRGFAKFAPGGKNFLSGIEIGAGISYFCSTLPDPAWSNLGDGKVLIPMLKRIFDRGSSRFSQILDLECGQDKIPPELEKNIECVIPGKEGSIMMNSGIFKGGDKIITANIPKDEYDCDYIDSRDIGSLIKNTPFKVFHEKTGRNADMQSEIWRTCLIAMLVFLILESFLCGTGSSHYRKKNIANKGYR